MLHDARKITSGFTARADLCIVGAGAAGISLAVAFIGRPEKVVLLESGAFELEAATQNLYRGSFDGPFATDGYLMSSRLRFFGGATNHWSGSVRPLDPIDFEKREWVPHSGWPITRAQLWPYYEQAVEVLDIPPFDKDGPEGYLLNGNPFTREEKEPFLMRKCVVRSKPVRFGSKYRKILIDADNIDVFTNANVTRFHARGGRVSDLDATSLEGPRFKVEAKALCTGDGWDGERAHVADF